MEVEALRRLIPKWKTDPKVEFYVHDKDAKCKKEIQNSQWLISELIDKNHLMKSFERRWKKFKKLALCKFRGLHNRIRYFFLFLLKEDMSYEEKIEQWLNVPEHLIGNHSKCLHANKLYSIWNDGNIPDNFLILKLFLNSTSKLFWNCKNSISTQMCESFHSVKNRFANKNTNWGDSWKMRIAAAVLSINEPQWKFVLYKKIGLPTMPRHISQILHQKDAERDRLRIQHREPEYLQKVNEYRIQKRAIIK